MTVEEDDGGCVWYYIVRVDCRRCGEVEDYTDDHPTECEHCGARVYQER